MIRAGTWPIRSNCQRAAEKLHEAVQREVAAMPGHRDISAGRSSAPRRRSMSIPREPLRRIVIVGGGQVGVLAAIAMRRALPVCEVVLVGAAPSPASFADWSPTALPFHEQAA